MRCRLELLGGMRLLIDGQVHTPAMRKAQLLLARVAMAGDVGVGRDTLCNLLWESSGDNQARASLRQALAHVRRSLGERAEALVAGIDRICLDRSQIDLDIDELEAWRSAPSDVDPLALLRGELLEGITWREPAIGDWLMAERRRIRLVEIDVLETAAAAAIGRNALPKALELTMRALERDRLRESLHRKAMQILAAQGETAAAIRQYRSCADILSRELSIRPEPETTALYDRIRAGRTAPAEQPVIPFAEPETTASAPLSGEVREVTILAGLAPVSADPEDMADAAAQLRRVGESCGAELACVVLEGADADLLLAFGLNDANEHERERARSVAQSILQAMPQARLGIASGRVIHAAGPPRQITGEARRVAIARAGSAKAGTLEDGERADGAADKDTSTRRNTEAPSADRPNLPFVGRRVELAQLRSIAETTAIDQSGTVVILRGAAGIGKTRLSQELQTEIEAEGGIVARIGFQSFGEQLPAIRQIGAMLAPHVPHRSDLSPAESAMRSFALGAPLPRGGVALLSAMPTTRFTELAAATIAQFTSEISSTCLLIIEDAHWADPGELAFLVCLAEQIKRSSTLMMVTERMSEARFGPALARDSTDVESVEIALRPLSERDALQLAKAFGTDASQSADAAIRRAEGNPLFLVRLLQATPEIDGMPASVVSLVQEQLDRLPEAERQAIRQASVLGTRFAHEEYIFCFGPAEFGASLFEGFLSRDGAALTFSHALVHEAIYSSITRADRLRLHARASQALRDRDPIKWAEHAVAGRTRDAARACAIAADILMPRHQFEAGMRFIESGMSLDAPPDARASLLLCRGSVHRERGDLDAALTDFAEGTECAEQASLKAANLAREAWVHRLKGDLDKADAALARASELSEQDLERDVASEIETQKGAQAFARGDHARCLVHNERAVELAEAPLYLSRALGGLGDAHYAAGRMRSAHKHFTACQKLAREHGLGLVEMAHGFMAAFSHWFADPGPDALALSDAAASRAAEAGNARSELVALTVRADLHLAAGMLDEARADTARCIELVDLLGAPQFALDVAKLRAAILSAEGDQDAALAVTRATLEAADSAFAGYYEPVLQGLRAKLTRNPAERWEALERMERVLNDTAVSHCHFFGRQSAIEALLAAQDWRGVERQADLLASYTAAEPLGWSDLVIVRARLLARRGRNQSADGDVEEARALATDLEDSLMRDLIPALYAGFPEIT